MMMFFAGHAHDGRLDVQTGLDRGTTIRLTLPLLAGVVVLKEYFSRRLLRLDAQFGATALKAEAWHHRSDAITSAAAFIGISIGVIGGQGSMPIRESLSPPGDQVATYNKPSAGTGVVLTIRAKPSWVQSGRPVCKA